MTLVLAGLVAGFRNEIVTTVDTFHADSWLVAGGTSGPFTASTPVADGARARAAAAPGVKRAEAVVLFRHTALEGTHSHPVNVIAAEPGGMVQPKVVDGRRVRRRGEAVVDRATGIALGSRVTIADTPLRIVGRTDGLSYFAGGPVLVA